MRRLRYIAWIVVGPMMIIGILFYKLGDVIGEAGAALGDWLKL